MIIPILRRKVITKAKRPAFIKGTDLVSNIIFFLVKIDKKNIAIKIINVKN